MATASAYLNLGQYAFTAPGGLRDLYEVPAGKAAVVSSLVVCNRGSSTQTFRFSHAIAGAADDPSQYLFWDVEVPRGRSYIATIGATAAETDVFRVYASSTDLSFNLYGQEVG